MRVRRKTPFEGTLTPFEGSLSSYAQQGQILYPFFAKDAQKGILSIFSKGVGVPSKKVFFFYAQQGS